MTGKIVSRCDSWRSSLSIPEHDPQPRGVPGPSTEGDAPMEAERIKGVPGGDRGRLDTVRAQRRRTMRKDLPEGEAEVAFLERPRGLQERSLSPPGADGKPMGRRRLEESLHPGNACEEREDPSLHPSHPSKRGRWLTPRGRPWSESSRGLSSLQKTTNRGPLHPLPLRPLHQKVSSSSSCPSF